MIIKIAFALAFAWAGFLVGMVTFILIDRYVERKNKPRLPDGEHIDLNAKCPACGHRGCTLAFIPPPIIERTPEGKTISKIEQAQVARKCDTCGAVCAQKPILAPKEWLA